MGGKELLEAHVLDAETGPQSCLVCTGYQYRDGARKVLCVKRLRVVKSVEDWTADDFTLSITRAQRCSMFDDSRDDG